MRLLASFVAIVALTGCAAPSNPSVQPVEEPRPRAPGIVAARAPTPLPDLSAGDPDLPDPDQREPWDLDRMVIAGDGWAEESAPSTFGLLSRHGFGHVEIVVSAATNHGATAAAWARSDHALADLDAALDGGQTGADLLLLFLGLNDYVGALREGLPDGVDFDREIEALADTFAADLAVILGRARAGRPDLNIVLVGYDYPHFEWLVGLREWHLAAPDTLSFNRGHVAFEARKLALANHDARVFYAHNLGILTHAAGNPVAPRFALPTVDYPPGFFDPPAGPPDHAPFPGGARRADLDPSRFPPESLPGPAHALADGLMLNNVGWTPLLDHTWTTVLEPLFWPSNP